MFTAIKTSAFLWRLINFIKIHQKRQQSLIMARHPALQDDVNHLFLVPWAGVARSPEAHVWASECPAMFWHHSQ